MKHAPTIAGGLLGLIFVVFGLKIFLKFILITILPLLLQWSARKSFTGLLN